MKSVVATLAFVGLLLFSSAADACVRSGYSAQKNYNFTNVEPCPAPVVVSRPKIYHAPRRKVHRVHVAPRHRVHRAPQRLVRLPPPRPVRAAIPSVSFRRDYASGHRGNAGVRKVCDPLRRPAWRVLIGTGDPAIPGAFRAHEIRIVHQSCIYVPRRPGGAVCVEVPSSTSADGLGRVWWYL